MVLPVTLLCAAQFLVVLDVTIVAVALPAIRDSLAMSPENLQWVVSAYTLTFGGLLIAAGRLGDVLGRRRLFTAGLVTFGAASLACALAPSAPALVAARAIQGAGAAMEAPAALALVPRPPPTAAAPCRGGRPRPPPAARRAGCSAAYWSRRSGGRPCSSSTCRCARWARCSLLACWTRAAAPAAGSTSPARSRSPPAWGCSCSGSRSYRPCSRWLRSSSWCSS